MRRNGGVGPAVPDDQLAAAGEEAAHVRHGVEIRTERRLEPGRVLVEVDALWSRERLGDQIGQYASREVAMHRRRLLPLHDPAFPAQPRRGIACLRTRRRIAPGHAPSGTVVRAGLDPLQRLELGLGEALRRTVGPAGELRRVEPALPRVVDQSIDLPVDRVALLDDLAL